jgi:hypothetical protein
MVKRIRPLCESHIIMLSLMAAASRRLVAAEPAAPGLPWSVLVATCTMTVLAVLLYGIAFATSAIAPYLASFNVVSISLDRSGCYGFCPSYRLTLRADGNATFTGTNFVRYGGTYVTSLRPAWFPRFADVLYKRGMFESRSPQIDVVDAQRITVTVAFKRGAAATTTSFGGFPGEAQDTANDVYASQLAIDATAGYLCGWHRAAAPSTNFQQGWYSPIVPSACPHQWNGARQK